MQVIAFRFSVNLTSDLHDFSSPPSAYSNQDVYQQVTVGYRMSQPPNCPDFLYDIMLQCWSAKPADRPDFKSLKAQLGPEELE